jgi:hypothetical protein
MTCYQRNWLKCPSPPDHGGGDGGQDIGGKGLGAGAEGLGFVPGGARAVSRNEAHFSLDIVNDGT